MTLVTLQRPFNWPGIIGSHGGNGLSMSGLGVMDAAGEYTAVVLCALEDMVISHVALHPTAAVGSPTADIRIETVDASTGLPSGTLWATNSNVITSTLVLNTTAVHALAAPATVNRGQVFCVKFAYNSGTNFQVGTVVRRVDPVTPVLPYIVLNTGTPSKSGVVAGTTAISLGSNSSTFYKIPQLLQVSSVGGGAFNNTNGARRGLRFTAQFNCRCIGLLLFFNGAVGDYNIIMMNDAGSELSSSSTAFEGDLTNALQNGLTHVFFDNPVTLVAGTTYRAVLEPSTSTNSSLQTLVLAGVDFRSASPCGTFGHYTSYASAAWDDSATATIPYMDLLLDQIDDGAGTGGGDATPRIIVG
jgi:hypothetical protein